MKTTKTLTLPAFGLRPGDAIVSLDNGRFIVEREVPSYPVGTVVVRPGGTIHVAREGSGMWRNLRDGVATFYDDEDITLQVENGEFVVAFNPEEWDL